jgi:hypothetical protein
MMSPKSPPLLHTLTAALIKTAVTVIALALVYPCIVTTVLGHR